MGSCLLCLLPHFPLSHLWDPRSLGLLCTVFPWKEVQGFCQWTPCFLWGADPYLALYTWAGTDLKLVRAP